LTSLRNNTPFDALEKGCFSFGEWLTRCRPVAARKHKASVSKHKASILKHKASVLKNNTDVFFWRDFQKVATLFRVNGREEILHAHYDTQDPTHRTVDASPHLGGVLPRGKEYRGRAFVTWLQRRAAPALLPPSPVAGGRHRLFHLVEEEARACGGVGSLLFFLTWMRPLPCLFKVVE